MPSPSFSIFNSAPAYAFTPFVFNSQFCSGLRLHSFRFQFSILLGLTPSLLSFSILNSAPAYAFTPFIFNFQFCSGLRLHSFRALSHSTLRGQSFILDPSGSVVHPTCGHLPAKGAHRHQP